MDYAALIQLIMQLSQQHQQQAQELGEGVGSGDKGKAFTSAGKATHSKTATAIGGYLSAKQEKKDKRRLKAKIEATRRITSAIQQKGLAQQEGLTRQGIAQQLSGYDIARKEASRLGAASKQQTIDEGQRMGAHVSQDLTNRGLSSTTIGGNLQRAVTADTSRGISGINQYLSGIFGDLAMGRAGAEAQGTAQLADLAAQRTNLGVEGAQFWLPQMLSSFGMLQGMGMADRRLGGGAQYSGQGMDMSALAGLFGQRGGGGGSNFQYSGSLGGGYSGGWK